MDRAGALVRRAIDEPFDPRLDERPGAHRARLYGRIDARFREPVIAELARGLAQGD